MNSEQVLERLSLPAPCRQERFSEEELSSTSLTPSYTALKRRPQAGIPSSAIQSLAVRHRLA